MLPFGQWVPCVSVCGTVWHSWKENKPCLEQARFNIIWDHDQLFDHHDSCWQPAGWRQANPLPRCRHCWASTPGALWCGASSSPQLLACSRWIKSTPGWLCHILLLKHMVFDLLTQDCPAGSSQPGPSTPNYILRIDGRIFKPKEMIQPSFW